MPPVPPTKFARTSIEGWSRKRSVSPSAKASSSKKVIGTQGSTDDIDMSPETKQFVPRRSDDGYYYEDEYRDEHVMCMLENEVRLLFTRATAQTLTLLSSRKLLPSPNSWTSNQNFNGACART